MPTYDTSTGLRALQGNNKVKDIDAGFLALAQDVAARLPHTGKSIIPTEETRTDVAYGPMPTPDRVPGIVLPADGLLIIRYQAMWKASTNNDVTAAIFIGANQLQRVNQGTAPIPAEAMGPSLAEINSYTSLSTDPRFGLVSGQNFDYSGDVTTGQLIGTLTIRDPENNSSIGDSATGKMGGAAEIFAAAGTYDISVQFKSTSGVGTVTAKNRKLWVQAIPF